MKKNLFCVVMVFILLLAVFSSFAPKSSIAKSIDTNPGVGPERVDLEKLQMISTSGTLTGIVFSDGITPVEGATIHVYDGGGFSQDTLSVGEGTYSMDLPPGTYNVLTTKYGHYSDEAFGVTIVQGETTIQDFTIPLRPISVVSGTVYDYGWPTGGYHGYPLYASIHITSEGFDETIFTDPFTGYYSIELAQDVNHEFTIEPYLQGYQSLIIGLMPQYEEVQRDFSVDVTPDCTAPGYFAEGNVVERFDAPCTPTGWFVADYAGNGQVWRFDDPGDKGNLTPGANGNFAIVDSDWFGSGYSQVTGLVSPQLDFTYETTVTLDFDMHYKGYARQSGTVYISIDGGGDWTPVWSAQMGNYSEHVTIDLSPYAAGQNSVMIEFRFFADWGYWWEIDDVLISPFDCQLVPGGIVSGYVYDANSSLPIAGADIFNATIDTKTIDNPVDPANEGLYWAFHPVVNPTSVAGTQSISGSHMTFDPTIGGSPVYVPGQASTFCFRSDVYDLDGEYLDGTWIRFPEDWAITDYYEASPGTCDGGVWSSFGATYETYPNELHITQSAYMEVIDHCVARYCFDVTPGTSPGIASWYYAGDTWSDPPHFICSNDQYTPGSMIDDPCEEFIAPPASIPLLQTYELIANKDQYLSDIQPFSLIEEGIIQVDFYLDAGLLNISPSTFEVNMTVGDPPLTEVLVLENEGEAEINFELVEKVASVTPPILTIPALSSELPFRSQPSSTGPAPKVSNSGFSISPAKNPFIGIMTGEPAYAMNVSPGKSLVKIPDINVPGVWSLIGLLPDNTFYAGDFVGGDFTKLYVTDYYLNHLYTVDPVTGISTMIGPANPPPGQVWTGLSGSPDGTLFGLTTNCSETNLVTVNPSNGSVTDLGALPTILCGIDLAYNPADELIYIVDTSTDTLFTVDPVTLEIYQIGPLGVDASSSAQGLDFEEESGVLYWAAYTTTGELRIIDTATGASTLVGSFPGGAEVDCLAFPTGGTIEVPWLSEDPSSGEILPNQSRNVNVVFDPTGAELTEPGDYMAELRIIHNTPYSYDDIPVILHLQEPNNHGTFNGSVLVLEACDINPASPEIAFINFWQNGSLQYSTTTDSLGQYSYSLDAGSYDIEAISSGYVTQIKEDQTVGIEETTTVDFTLRLDAPCITVDPASLDQTQPTNSLETQLLTLSNTGAGEGSFKLVEIPSGQINSVVNLALDDGTVEDIGGPGIPKELIWVNRFSPPQESFPFTLDYVLVYFTSGGSVQVGDDIILVVYEKQNANIDPAVDANLLLAYPTTIHSLDTWNTYSLPAPLQFNELCDVIIGVISLEKSETYAPIAIDTSSSAQRSWLGMWSISPPPYPPMLPPNEAWEPIDLVLPGNFMVRGQGNTLSGDILWLTLDPITDIIPPDSELDVIVSFNSNDLADGDYSGAIRVKSLLADFLNIDVPVTLHVISMAKQYLPMIIK